jgi:hypothetical protein
MTYLQGVVGKQLSLSERNLLNGDICNYFNNIQAWLDSFPGLR